MVNFTNEIGDAVSYQAYNKRTREYHNYRNAACYMSIMAYLTDCEVWCFPQKTQDLPFEIFLRITDEFKKNKLLPSGVIAYSRSGRNYMYIPPGQHKFYVYVALCLYRWVDSFRKLCWDINVLLDRDVYFYQALHHALSSNVANDGHSFLSVGASYYGSKAKPNLSQSVILKSIACGNLSEIANWVNTSVTNKAQKLFGNQLVLSHMDDLLHPDIRPIYDLNPEKDRKKIIELVAHFNSSKKKGKK